MTSTDSQSTLDRHKEAIRRLFDEVWTRAEFGSVQELIAPRFVFHFRGRGRPDAPEGLVPIVLRWKAAFPDVRFEAVAIVAEGDMAAARVVYRGTHRGAWKGIPPTGRQIEVEDMMFFRFEDGRIAEVWEVADEHWQRQQLAEGGD